MTVRHNVTKGPPTNEFYLHADRVGQSKAGNYSTIRLIVECISRGNSSGSSGYALSHGGSIDGAGGGSHYVSSLPSGYGPGAYRWSVHVADVNVGHGADGTRGAVTLRHTISSVDSDFAGEWTVSYSDFPAIVNMPDAPSGVSAARVSDSQATVNWTRNSSGNKVWSGVYVERWSVSSGTWVQVANVTSAVGTWTDTSISANDRYKYRVQSYNSAGSSVQVESGMFVTTPAAPTNVSAARNGMDIDVTWQNNARYETGADIYDNETLVGSVGAGVVFFKHIAPNPAVVHNYKIKTKSDSLVSAFSTPSNPVQLQSPPLIPLDVKVDKQVYALESPPTSPTIMSWSHNPIDSSLQSKYDLQILVGSTWTNLGGTKTSDIESRNIRPDLQSPNRWTIGSKSLRVRTYGAHATPSPYSDPATFTIENIPTVSIISPSSPTFDFSRMTVNWSYAQAQSRPQTSAKIEVIRDGSVVHTEIQAGTATSRALSYTFLDDTTYQIAITVTSSSGLDSDRKISTAFYVDYLEPQIPIVSVEFNTSSGAHIVSFVNDESPIPAEFNRVYRNIIQDSEWMLVEPGDPMPEFRSEEWELVGEYPANSTATDYQGLTKGKTVYLVEAVSSIPSASRNFAYAVVDSKKVWIGAGPGYGDVVSVAYDLKIATKNGIADQQEHQLEGRKKPVLVSGDYGFQDVSVSGSIDPLGLEGSTREQLDRVAQTPGAKMYRDMQGRRIAIAIDSFDYGRESRVENTIEFSGKEVER